MAKALPGTSKLAKARASLARQRMTAKQTTRSAVSAGVAVATGGLLGFARGKWAEKDETTGALEWNVPATDIPYEAAIGLLVGGAGLLGYGGALAPHMLSAGQTALALTAARLAEERARKSAEEAANKK